MARTFEGLASGEMDAMYQGALFLSGGDPERAEALVVDTVMLAFREHAADTDPQSTRRWFEARLVRSYLRREQTRRDEPAPSLTLNELLASRPPRRSAEGFR